MAKQVSSESSGVGEEYLRLIFDPHRFGFRRVAERILMSGLDYGSFVNFKRSAKFLREYISHFELETPKFRRKLSRDWSKGNNRMRMLPVPTSATHALIFDNDRRLLVAVDKRVFVFNLMTGDLETTFCGHQSKVSCLALEGDLAVSGDLNGMLYVWEWRTGTVVVEKQMFGRIEALKVRNGYLATGHISKSYDTGCVSIRKFDLGKDVKPPPTPPPQPAKANSGNQVESPKTSPTASPSEKKKPKVVPESASKVSTSESCAKVGKASKVRYALDLPVCFSWFGDIFPVADLDFNSKYMSILQWNCTFMGVNTGSVGVYRFASKERLANLSKAGKCTFSRCLFVPGAGNEQLMLTASDDGMLRLWRLPDAAGGRTDCLRFLSSELPIVNVAVDRFGYRVVARDTEGDTVVWDLTVLRDALESLEDGKTFDEDSALVLRDSSRAFTTHTALDISARRFVMGNLDTSVLCYDVWRND